MKECTHCGGPNAPENGVCDYCGMGFSEDTIPEGSVDPREQAKLDEAAWREANREKDLVEFSLDSKDDQHVNVNLPGGQTIRINDPVEKAAALAGTLLTGTTASTLKKAGVRIYEYNGFNHAKMFVSDDEKAIVGTINLDYRSLYLHFENGCYMYKVSAVEDIRKDFEYMFENSCKELSLDDCMNRPFGRKFASALLKILEPML